MFSKRPKARHRMTGDDCYPHSAIKHLNSTMKAIWNNKTFAETKETVLIENNHYFPSDAIKNEFF